MNLGYVYVDHMMDCVPNRNWPYTENCHMFVDVGTDIEVLHELAAKIGLAREWFQDHKIPHYDLTRGKRSLAIRRGAVSVEQRQAALIFKKWREQNKATNQ